MVTFKSALRITLVSLFGGIVAWSAVISLGDNLVSTAMPVALRKDFVQEWHMGRAALSGVDPYAPTPELVARWHPGWTELPLPNASPHPPGAIWLGLPLALLSYSTAARVWLVVELGLLAHLVVRTPGGPQGTAARLVAWFALIGWEPVYREIVLGQINLLSTCLLVEALRHEGARAGIAHGLALAVKIAGWPLLAHRLLRRESDVAVTAVGVAGAATVGTAAWVGVEPLVRYATTIVPAASAMYRLNEWNLAPSAIAARLFEGTRAAPLIGNDAPALLGPASAAPIAAALTTLVWVAGALLLARRVPLAANGGLFLIAAGAVANPVAWNHGLVAAVPALLACRPRLDLSTGVLVIAVALAQVDPLSSQRAASWLIAAWPEGASIAPLLSSLPLLVIPAVGLSLLHRVDPGDRASL